MSDKLPHWLPESLNLEPWHSGTYDELYNIFCRDFKSPNILYFRNEKIIIFSHSTHLENGKESIFWHITNKEDKSYSERLPDLRRAERINWIRPIIENYTSSDIYFFDLVDSRQNKKTYLWLYKYNFVVILKKLTINYVIVTAFYVSLLHAKKDLLKKYTMYGKK